MVLLSSEIGASGVAFVSLKAFGDYVIARGALRHAGTAGNAVRLIVGEHLLPLHEALGGRAGTVVLSQGESVPAMFDVKRAGIPAALCSAMRLRSALRRVARESGLTLVFDRLGPRERFLAAGGRAISLPESDNIYRAYAGFFGLHGDVIQPQEFGTTIRTKVGVFPGSRIPAKQLPDGVIARLVSSCAERDADVTVFCLKGEPLSAADAPFGVSAVPRDFGAMRDAVASCDFVITADSMPAHMAELIGRPVFVVSPVSNTYWLPLSSLINGHWMLFDDMGRVDEKLHAFLSSEKI